MCTAKVKTTSLKSTREMEGPYLHINSLRQRMDYFNFGDGGRHNEHWCCIGRGTPQLGSTLTVARGILTYERKYFESEGGEGCTISLICDLRWEAMSS